MGTIAEKLTYLGETKQAIKAEANRLLSEQGKTEIADTDAFRAYADKLATVTSGDGGSTLRAGAMPIVSYLSENEPADAQSAITLTLPEGIEAGDALVIFGLRRGALNSLAGWTEAPAPPLVSYEQWTYAYYRVADGTEGGQTVTISYSSGSNRLYAGLLVVKHPLGGAVAITHVASLREATGEQSLLTVPDNANSAALTAIFMSRAFLAASGDTYLRVDNSTIAPNYFSRHQTPYFLSRNEGSGMRVNTYLAESLDETTSLPLVSDLSSPNESLSAIWIEFTI